jgi:hypothetical protein
MRGVMRMKKILIDFLWGILIFIFIMICEFVLTLPFAEPTTSSLSRYITYEFLLMAVPAGIITLLFAFLTRTKTKSEALLKSTIWTIVAALFYLIIAVGNGNFKLMFGRFALYVLLACVFAGPLIYAKIRKL